MPTITAQQTKSTLEAFNKYVITQSKSNLTKGGHNFSKLLYNSLKSEVKATDKSFESAFFMESHGQFQDKGVKGKFSSAKAPNSPFKFGNGTGPKGGLTSGMLNWVTKKRIQFKNRETGKFLSYKQTAMMITKSIYTKGLAPTNFFTKPFEDGFKKLPEDLVFAYGLDVETFLKYTLNG